MITIKIKISVAATNPKKLLFILAIFLLFATSINNFNTLYILFIASKWTQIVIQSKVIIEVKKKFDKIHINLLRPYYLLLLLKKLYAAI